MKIEYIHEPTDLQCGQAVLAMVLGIPVGQVCAELGNERETTLREMREYFEAHGVKMAAGRSQAQGKEDLPRLALLSLETPRCWHWSLYADGVFYDPEHGVLDDFPECNRKYFWGLEAAESVYGTSDEEFEKRVAEIETDMGRKLSEPGKKELWKTTE